MLRAERDLASLRTLAEAGEHGFAEEAPLSADNEPLVSSLLDLHKYVVSVSVDVYKGKNPHLACARPTSKERVEPVRRLLVTIRT